MTGLNEVLNGLVSPDNNVREQNEKVFEEVWQSQPTVLIPNLCQVISTDNSPPVKALAAIILRRSIAKMIPVNGTVKMVRVWNQMEPVMQQQCGTLLLQSWQNESNSDTRNKISDVIAEVARIITVHEEWQELLKVLWSLSGQSGNVIVSGLRILAAVPDCIHNQSGDVVATYLGQFVSHPDMSVRVSALKTIQSVVTNVPDDKKASFSGIFTSFPDLLGDLAQRAGESEESEYLIDSLQSIVEMTDDCPKLFRSLAPRLVPVLIAIVNAQVLGVECQSAALELLTSLVEAVPGAFKKKDQQPLISNLVNLLLKTISECLETSSDEWYQSTPEDENEEEVLSLTAEQSLDRISIALGGKTLLPSLMSTIPGMSRSSDWRHRYASLRAIANMAEGCADVLEDRLNDLLSIVWPAFTDSYPRVQYAACHALGQLCTDFSGTLQEHFAQQCLSNLVGVLINSNQPRVQCHAAAALINFAEGVDSALISPVLEELLQRLVALLNSNVLYLQEQVLATMAAFSSAAGKSFVKYLQQIMPLLFGVLNSTLDKSYRQLQCRALEASTMVALAVGKDNFQNYSQELLGILVKLQQTELEDDDMMLDYLSPSWVRMCQTLGGRDFAPFIGMILPRLLQEAQEEPDVAIIDASNPGEEEEFDPNEWDFATIKGRRMGIHTATLDIKCSAVENLTVYIATLDECFTPYVNDTFNVVLPLVGFHMHEGVQAAAAESLASLIKVAHKAGKSEALMMALESLKSIFNELGDPSDADLTVSLLDAAADIVNVGITLPNDVLIQSFTIIDSIITILLRNQSNRQSKHGNDDEEEEENSDDQDEEVIYGITRFAASLFGHFKGASLNVAVNLLQFCFKCILSGKPSLFRHAAICILDDFVHHLGEQTSSMRDLICQCFAKGLLDEDADCRQASCFGIGMCSENAPTLYEAFCIECIPMLLKIIEHQDSKAPSMVSVTDNAMAAISRILKAYPSTANPNLLSRWITGLPVTHDEQEAPTVYSFFLSILPHLSISTDRAPMVLYSLMDPIIHETFKPSSTIKQEVLLTLKTLRQQFGAQVWQAAASMGAYTPEQLLKLD